MRRNDLDNLRWATVLLVLVYHVCYLFNGVGILGNIPGAPNLPLGDWFAATVYPWFMALLFLAAGITPIRPVCGAFSPTVTPGWRYWPCWGCFAAGLTALTPCAGT